MSFSTGRTKDTAPSDSGARARCVRLRRRRARKGEDKMMAAIYARKSTEQNDSDADAKSIAVAEEKEERS